VEKPQQLMTPLQKLTQIRLLTFANAAKLLIFSVRQNWLKMAGSSVFVKTIFGNFRVQDWR